MNEDSTSMIISVNEKLAESEFEDISDYEDEEIDEDESDEDDILDATNEALIELQVFIIGFQLCANETINYLINDEGLAPEDPIVVKLWEHLKLQEKMITAEYLKLINLV